MPINTVSPLWRKWLCSIFGCKIQKTLSKGFFHVECHRCGEVFSITSKEKDWDDRAIQAILVDCSLFSKGFHIDDYRKAGGLK